MTSLKLPYKYFLFSGILLIAAGCSVEKNTATNRFFHGMTSRYNIYFNGRESFKTGVARVEAGHMDDFSNLLDIFEYSDPSSQSLCAIDMERAIQKASKVISLKSITAKPEINDNSLPSDKEEEFMNRKEYNEWVDDSYLLMGKARLYKRDYDLAKSTLSYNISSSVDDEIISESTIWLARVYNETGNYNESFRILNEMPTVNFSDYMRGLYFTTLADLFMKQKRYDEAIDPLGKALEYLSGKRNKYRLTYLLAQLYEKKGDASMATSLYRKVVKMNPPYDVEFNARINIAGVFDLNSGSPESIKKELSKMLRDSKNKEFLDQIYFALGKLYEREGNSDEAIKNYMNSAASSTVNRNQLAKSFLALADYYFSIPDYVNAGSYYDSTLLVIDQKYPDYQFIRSVSLSLNELVAQLSVIQREDSLQRVAGMTPDQRNLLIALIIQDVTQSEADKANTNQYTDQYNLGQYYENERRFQNNIQAEGKWYFYNQTALAFGRTEFRRRWGERRLEDNWRRLNKSRATQQGQAATGQEEKEQVKIDTLSPEMNNKSPEFYLRDLPVNDSLMAISNEKIAGALLESGKIYMDNFMDNEKAVESFEALLIRFPGNVLEPETFYNLYKLYQKENNQKAEVYRQKLIEKYPDNEYSKIITDPEYYNKKLEQMREAEKLYQDAYDAYLKEDFTDAISICDSTLVIFSKHELAPKFMLLRSFCIARTEDERTFKEELARLIKKWPDTPEAKRSSEIIAYLNQEIPQLQVEEDTQIAQEIYLDDKDSPHTFVLVIKNPKFNFNQASFDVISYNIDNYTNSNYRTQGSLVDEKYIMLTVSGFTKMQDAMDYYNSFRVELIVRNPSSSQMMTFIIGKQNLETFIKDKNPDRYMIFFREKYLNEETRR